jgi:hypothetical protein
MPKVAVIAASRSGQLIHVFTTWTWLPISRRDRIDYEIEVL